MTNQRQPELEHAITQGKVIANIEDLRKKITDELQKYAENQSDRRTERQRHTHERFQREIARLTVLLQRTERLVLGTADRNYRKLGELNNLVNSLKIGISTLFHTQPNIELSRQIRLTVEQEIIRNENPPVLRFIARRFSYAWHSPSTPLKVIHGLIFSFIIIFGGLFTLAILQYAVHRSHISVLNYPTLKEITEAQRGELMRKNKELNSEIIKKRREIHKSVIEPTAQSSKNPAMPLITDASQDSFIRGELVELEDEKRLIEEAKIELNQNLLRNKPNSTQEVLSNFFDIGISRTLSQILWVAAAGTLGSIISILIRVIDEFNNKEYQDRLTPFFLGFFKPVIGASFGVLFLAIYNAEFVNIPFIARTNQTSTTTAPKTFTEGSSSLSTFELGETRANGTDSDPVSKNLNTANTTSLGLIWNKNIETEKERKEAFFLFAIAFVVGFSERLAKDTIGRIDGSNSPADKPSSTSSNAARMIIVRSSKPRSQTTNSNHAAENSSETAPKQVNHDLDQRRTLNEDRFNERDE